MTREDAQIRVRDAAAAEEGYLEKSWAAYKADPSCLFDKKKGAGRDNVTKYWYDIRDGFQGGYWCQVFAYWVFTRAFGADKAKQMLYLDDWKSGDPWTNFDTMSWRANFEAHGARVQTSKAQVGDMVFYHKSHVGIVYKLDSDYLYTIEGNTSPQDGVNPNGGGVWKKRYKRTSSGVDAVQMYGRPDWSVVESIEPVPAYKLKGIMLDTISLKEGQTIYMDKEYGDFWHVIGTDFCVNANLFKGYKA